MQDPQTQAQNSNTQKIENSNPNLNLRLFLRAYDQNWLFPCFTLVALAKDRSKFSEYGSPRFTAHQHNFSGNYSTFEENKKSLHALTKSLARRAETYTEKTIDKILSQLLVSGSKKRSHSIDQAGSSPKPNMVETELTEPVQGVQSRDG